METPELPHLEQGDYINEYAVIRQLGKGAAACVFEVKTNVHGRDYFSALKLFSMNHTHVWETELNILRKLKRDPSFQSRCLMNVLDSGSFQIDATRYNYISFPLLGSSLFDVMYHEYKITETVAHFLKEDIKEIGWQIASALQFVHSKNIIHGDVKPENVMFVDPDVVHSITNSAVRLRDNRIKLIDFNGSIEMDDDYYITAKSKLQTMHYRAPEVCLGSAVNTQIDVWSYGCLLFEMYSGDVLFSSIEEPDLVSQFYKTFGVRMPSNMLRKAQEVGSINVRPSRGSFRLRERIDLETEAQNFESAIRFGEPEAIPTSAQLLRCIGVRLLCNLPS
ncbi:unnamed protein product [Caenorhabditis auriculariae]|uniref:Protein kinase domain-containing protein n=1 Tax=Caenorhabditis auriculariae TaxID=2777116 RepID=A0A8S1H418_9PELO|nr:unnamed protein product [Caenorhabditis auriculariae]